MLRTPADVFALVLTIPTTSWTDNIAVDFTGVKMVGVEEDEIIITGRKHEIELEQAGGGNVRATIYIQNDGTQLQERIDALLDEEYAIEPMVSIRTISNSKPLSCTVDYRRSEQTIRAMPIDMAPGVQDVVEYLSSTSVELEPDLMAELVKELNAGEMPDVIAFVQNLANL